MKGKVTSPREKEMHYPSLEIAKARMAMVASVSVRNGCSLLASQIWKTVFLTIAAIWESRTLFASSKILRL